MSARHKSRLKKIAITGGIGSGKSTLVQALADLGYSVFDADLLVAQVVLEEPTKSKIISLFGSHAYITDADGHETYNRAWVRDQVFADDAKRKALEAIVHPAIFKSFAETCRSIESLAGGVWVFYEAALIFEAGREQDFDAVVSVLSPEEERLARLKSSRHLSEEALKAIFAAQVNDEIRRAKSHFIFENRGVRAEIPARAHELIESLMQFFHPKSH
ncbi:dephospho-CoA kinase [bacterium]|nr:dephospho-CoA kinase [bacterium]